MSGNFASESLPSPSDPANHRRQNVSNPVSPWPALNATTHDTREHVAAPQKHAELAALIEEPAQRAGKGSVMSSFTTTFEHAQTSPKDTADSTPVKADVTDNAGKPCDSTDWLASATLFAIIGGGAALLLADWSMAAGAVSAIVSAAAGVVFVDQ